MIDIEKVEKLIGVHFNDPNYLQMALTHRSYLNEHKDSKGHNERLEFLGDAVLELVTTEFLYKNYPNPEGELTNWRSALVKTETISDVAMQLGVEEYIMMSRGEKKSFGRSRQLILANTFEAIVGATYLDQGFETAREFITTNLLVRLDHILEAKLYIDPKSEFQEMAQERDGLTPRYEVVAEEGPDHNKRFNIGVFVGETKWGEGSGTSKQSAQQEAAADAVKKYRK
jgi:ribonuclease III